jgi:hypothetical protein
MLYDNALLAVAYCEAYQLFQKPIYLQVVTETLDYLLRDMRDPRGAFHSAEDAGEVGREGEYYVWTPRDLERALGSGASRLAALYGVSDTGNFEHGASILALENAAAWSDAHAPENIAAREALYAARAERARPHRDDKILTSWNGLAISALATGYRVTGATRYLDAAKEAASFVLSTLGSGGKLLHRYRDGDANIPGMLEDYAYLVGGLLSLVLATGDGAWLDSAVRVQDEQHEMLWDAASSSYVSSAAAGLIVRPRDWSDAATPSGNGVSLSNLTLLHQLSGERRFSNWAEALEQGVPEDISRYPVMYSSLLRAALRRAAGPRECVVAVPDGAGEPPEEVRTLWQRFLPDAIVAWSAGGKSSLVIASGKSSADGCAAYYVCREHTCSPPLLNVDEALGMCTESPPLMAGGAPLKGM